MARPTSCTSEGPGERVGAAVWGEAHGPVLESEGDRAVVGTAGVQRRPVTGISKHSAPTSCLPMCLPSSVVVLVAACTASGGSAEVTRVPLPLRDLRPAWRPALASFLALPAGALCPPPRAAACLTATCASTAWRRRPTRSSCRATCCWCRARRSTSSPTCRQARGRLRWGQGLLLPGMHCLAPVRTPAHALVCERPASACALAWPYPQFLHSHPSLPLPLSQTHTQPCPQIIADDVKCTHGCTVSDLEEEELFYLK